MLEFVSVSWKNFLSTGNAYTTVRLDRSKTTLIVGANGAGKTTMIDALVFGLYGKPYRKINKPQLINSINGRDCEVTVEFNAKGDHYKIVRGIKPHKFEIWRNGALVDQNAGNIDYQDWLEKHVLHMSSKTFLQVAVLGSGNYVPFMMLSAYQRRELVEDLLDIQVFTKMNNLLKIKVQNDREESIEIRGRIQMNEALLDQAKSALAALVAESSRGTDLVKTSIADLESLCAEYEREIGELRAASENLATRLQLDASAKRMALAKSAETKLRSTLAALASKESYYRHERNCSECGQDIPHDQLESRIADLLTDKEACEANLAQVLTRATSVAEKHAEVTSSNAERERCESEIRERSRALDTLNGQLSRLRTELDAPRGDGSIKQQQAKIDEYLESLSSAERQLRDLLDREQVNAAALLLLKDSGIKSLVMRQYMPVINKLINKYLAQMDFYALFELDENFNESIKSRHRDEFSYSSFSEGEKMRIDLALLFGWRHLAKMRNSASTNLLIMDEVMDGSMDDSGTDEFMKLVETVASDTHVFVVSHKGDALFDKFHSVIKFEKVGEFSRMAV